MNTQPSVIPSTQPSTLPSSVPMIVTHKQTVYGLCMTPALGFIPIRTFEEYGTAYTWIMGELTKRVAGQPTEINQMENYLRFMIVPDFTIAVLDGPEVLAPQLIDDYLGRVL